MKSIVKIAFVTCSALISAAPLWAQEFKPTKAVTMVIPFGPGGGNDVVGRAVSEELSKLWGQPVVVENRPGAGSSVGAAHVAQSQADGYTLMFISTSYATAAAIQKALPFDPVKDIRPVAMTFESDLVMVAGPRNEIKTLDDYKAAAEKGDFFTATPGLGAIAHLTGLVLEETLGLQTEYVHHTSGANVMTDMGGGRVDVSYTQTREALDFDFTRPIVSMSMERTPAFPDMPSIAELGYPEAAVNFWSGVFAPGGLPDDVAKQINADVVKVMAEQPRLQKIMADQGMRPSTISDAEFAAIVKADIEKWTGVAERHGLRK